MLKIIPILCAVLAVTAAQASPRHKHARPDSQIARACEMTNSGRVICRGGEKLTSGHAKAIANDRAIPGHDPRPAAWCGWQLRQWLGVADRAYNLARNWAHYGTRANGPAPGVIAVYPHHVGIVVSVPRSGRMVLKSGNDGHAVRTRERSTRGVIAWRWPPQRWAGL